MRNFTFKGLFLAAMFMVLGSLAIQAADNGLITRQVTVKVYEAGTLSEKIAWFFSNFGTFMYLSLRRPLSAKEKSMLFHP